MEENKEYTYYAFISYKREEEPWAKWLQRKLEHYRFPTNLNGREDLPKRIYPTFRDVTDLNPGQLAVEIDKNLQDSEWLIVMCSPRSAQSPWVCKEAQTFIDLGRADHIIPFIIDGTPFSDDIATECYPEALRNLTGQEELLAANINEMGRDAAAIKVVSRMFNVRFDILWQRYERERRRHRNWIITAVMAFIIFLLGIIGYILNQNNRLLESNSRAAASAAERLIEEGDSYRARFVAAEALKIAYSPEAEGALRRAFQKDNAILQRRNWGLVDEVVYSPDGKTIVSLNENGSIYIWDAITGRCIHTLNSPNDNTLDYNLCNSVTYSPDGKKIVSALYDTTIRVWDVSTGHCTHILKGHKDEIPSAIFSPDGKKILSVSYDNTLRLWDANSGHCLQIIECDTFSYNLLFSPDGKAFISILADNRICIWDALTSHCIHTLKGFSDKGFSDCIIHSAFSPDGKNIATASDNNLCIWDIATGQCLFTIKEHTSSIVLIAYSPDGKYIVSGSDDNTIRLWDATTGECLDTIVGNSPFIFVAFSPVGNYFVSFSGDYDATENEIQIWSIINEDSKPCLINENTLRGHTGGVTSVSFSPNGKNLVSASYYDNTIRIWDLESEHSTEILGGILTRFHSYNFSPNKKRLVLVSDQNNKTINIIDATTKKILLTLVGHTKEVRNAVYSPDGKKVLSTSYDKTLRIWNATTGRCIHTLIGHDNNISAAAFSPDGKKIVSASTNDIRIWDVATGKCMFTIEAYFWSINHVNFSIDGKKVVLADTKNTLYIWEFPSLEELLEKTKKQFNDYTLTAEERRLYYLE